MVRTEDLESAREALRLSQKGSHLEVVGEFQPLPKTRGERWIVALLLALALLVYFLTK